ncbi:exported hypothetical protein [Tenacibaculum amylolyticum]
MLLAVIILLSSLNFYAQNFVKKAVTVDSSGWKRLARLTGSVGRGYNEITIATTGGANAPTVSKISWFKGYSNYGGIHTETLSDILYWSEARITYDGTHAYLEINFTRDVPNLTVYLDQSVWTGGNILEGNLAPGAGDVVTSTRFGRFSIGGNKLYVDKGNDGNVGIGTSTPSQKLDVEGIAELGNSSTYGGVFLAQQYSGDDYLATLSSNYSSGALILGYGVAGMSSQGSSGQLVSTFDNFSSHRGALRIGKGTLEFLNTPTAVQTAVNDQLSIKSRFFIDNNGKVGIGTSTPGTSLDVHNGTLKVSGGSGLGQETARLVVDSGASYGHSLLELRNNNGVVLKASGSAISIGTIDTPSDYKLAVAGKIISEEITIKLQSTWPDYVFTDDYNLPTLKEVEQHIKEKGHLENIPSAKEVEENGVKLGEMNKKLLEKVEELTLYTIQQQKQLENQNKEIEKLKSLVKQLINSRHN